MKYLEKFKDLKKQILQENEKNMARKYAKNTECRRLLQAIPNGKF